MFFFDCEQGFVPDNGQNDVTDGTVENYDFDWCEPAAAAAEADVAALAPDSSAQG
jgi:hypothetical protein